MNKSDAENIVSQKMDLKSLSCVIVPDATKEFSKCFAVFYQSKQYVEAGDFNHMLVGHGGVLVDKETENIFRTGSAYPIERYVEAFEESGDPNAEKSDLLLVVQCANKENATDVIKYLHSRLNIGLAQSKKYVDTVVGGNSIEINCKDPLIASEVCGYLNNHGFLTKQLWKNSANNSLQPTGYAGG
jgi:hypothetical protein